MQTRSLTEIIDDIRKLDTSELIRYRDANEQAKDTENYIPQLPQEFELLMDELKDVFASVYGIIRYESIDDHENVKVKKQSNPDITADKMFALLGGIDKNHITTWRNLDIGSELINQYIAYKDNEIEIKIQNEKDINGDKNHLIKFREEEEKNKKYNGSDQSNLTNLYLGLLDKILESYEKNGLIIGILNILEDAKSSEKDGHTVAQLNVIINKIKNLKEFTESNLQVISNDLEQLDKNGNNGYISLVKNSFSNNEQIQKRFIFDKAIRSNDKQSFILKLLLQAKSQNQNQVFLSKIDEIYERISKLTVTDLKSTLKEEIIPFLKNELINYPEAANKREVTVARDLLQDEGFYSALEVELQNRSDLKKIKDQTQLMEELVKRIPLSRVRKEIEILFPLKNSDKGEDNQGEKYFLEENIDSNELIDFDILKRDKFNRKFFDYQMKNAYKIWNWQLDLKIPELKQLADQPRIDTIKASKEEVNMATSQFSKEFINNIKRMIETTSWKVSGLKFLDAHLGGKTIHIKTIHNGNEISKPMTVPTNVAKIYKEILAAQKDKNWIEHFKKVVEIGENARHPHLFDFFGLSKRNPETQKFYDLFAELSNQSQRIYSITNNK